MPRGGALKVLIVKLSSLGDIIQTLPVVHDLHAHLPGVEVDWVVEEAFADLLTQVPGIRTVLPCAQRRWRKSWWRAETRHAWRAFVAQLRSQAYDLVLDAQGLVKSAWVARQARLLPGGFSATFGNASALCSYERPVRWLLDRPIPMEWQIHAVDRTRLLAGRALGYSPNLDQPRYPFKALAPHQRHGVFIGHGTTRADNEWPDAAWIDFAQRVIASGETVLLPQVGAREQARVAAWAAQLGAQAQILPPMSLAQLLPVLQSARGAVSVDSGLGHLAVALGLPVVQIFSQPRIARAGPKGVAHQCAVGGDHAPDVETVWQAWCQMRAAEEGA